MSSEFESVPTSRELLDYFHDARRRVLDEGRPEAVARQHGKGRLTARERVARLCDADGFREIGSLVEPQRDSPLHEGLVAPADGVVIGTGQVDGRPASVVAYDFTVAGGSSGKVGQQKLVRAIDRAIDCGMPLVLLLEGGGHRIQDGQDARRFASASVTFQALSRLSGWAPVAAAMMGSTFAGHTNYAAMADFVVMIRGASAMGLAGPALVKAAIGEEIGQEELGGASMHVDETGVADLAVTGEEEAIAAIRRFLSYLPSNARAEPPIRRSGDPAGRREGALLDLVPADGRKTYDVRKVIALIADRDSLFELKPTYARNIVTCFARLDGRPVGFVASQPSRMGGMLDVKACEKAAHFVALCDAFGLPLVYLVDVPGFVSGSAAERTGLARRSAKMLYELGRATVPRISIVLRKGYGLAYLAMCGGRSFEADAAVAWPTAEICAMSIEGAVDVAFRRDYETAPDPDARRRELIDLFRSQRSALRAAENFGIDEVIDPRDTRRFLIETLAACPPRRRDRNPPKFRSIAPI